MEIITPLFDKAGRFLFPAGGGKEGKYIRWTAKTRERIQKRTGLKDWTAHDLRRTGRTMLSRLGVRIDIAERILNHSRGKIEATYDLHGFLDEKRVALDKLGREIDRIVGRGKQAETIPTLILKKLKEVIIDW